MISSSDIAIITLLGTIIECGRNHVSIDIQEVLLILTFLSDNLKLGTCIQNWKNKDEYLEQLLVYISQESILYSNVERKLQLRSIDELIDLIDVAQQYLIHPNDVDPNGVSCPYCFKRDSIVGVYIRAVISRWDILHFGEISVIYENFLNFLDGTIPSRPKSAAIEIYPVQSMVLEEPRDYLVNAENATVHSDLLPAVESIHAYFDSNGPNPLRSKNDLVSQTKNIIDNYLSGSPQQKSRYQQAMLNLANMWLRNGYYFYSSTATEEGMKMAHQLGDHTSVTYALLLLHHIIHGQENAEVLTDESRTGRSSEQSTESILIRCIQKSFDLKLKSLEIQAIQLLVRYRMKGPLRECVPPSIGFSISDHHSSITEMTPYMLWTLLQSTFSDKPSLLFSKSSNQSKQKSQSNDSTASSASTTLTNQNKLQLYCHSYLLSSDLWSRLYLPSMSLLMCFRAFRHCGSSLSTDSLLEIILQFCSQIHELNDDGSVCNLFLLGVGGILNSQETNMKILSESQQKKLRYTQQKLKLSSTILNSLLSMDQLVETLSPEVKLKMNYTKLIIQIKQYLVLYFLSDEPAENVEYLHAALRCSNMLIEHHLNQPKFYHSQEYVQVNIYYCFIMSYLDYRLALNRIEELQRLFQRSECNHWKIELNLMKIIILYKEIYQNGQTNLFIQLKVHVLECLRISQREYLPAVRNILSEINQF